MASANESTMPISSAWPSGYVVFLVSDIQGWVALSRSLHSDWRVPLLTRHFDIIRRHVADCGGTFVKSTGDGSISAFADGPAAIRAAVAVQREFQNHILTSADVKIRVRMGLHAGLATPFNGDYFSAALDECHRVARLAHGGQIVLTERAHPPDAPPAEGFTLRRLGHFRVRDVGDGEPIDQVLAPGLPHEFPPLHAESAFPSPSDPLLGRERELARIQEFLRDGNRPGILLLHGPIGVGKTRLAIEAARAAARDFTDPPLFVDWSAAEDPTAASKALAAALRLADEPGEQSIPRLARALRDQPKLVVIDHADGVMETAGALLTAFADAPADARAKLIVTSAAKLPVNLGKHMPLEPIEVPSSAARGSAAPITENPAVQLFLEHARAVAGPFEPTRDEADAIAAIVRNLDGLPLLIKIAASQARHEGARALIERLRMATHATFGKAGALPSMLESAIASLPAEEQSLLMRMSVFVGGFTLSAAIAVNSTRFASPDAAMNLDESPVRAEHVPYSLARLVQASLLSLDRSTRRYYWLGHIRQFALARLEKHEPAAVGDCRRAHARFFHEFTRTHAEKLARGNLEQVLTEFDTEDANITAAIAAALEHHWPECPAVQFATDAQPYWFHRGRLAEGRALLERILREAPGASAHDRARALNALGLMAAELGDRPAAREAYEASLAHWRAAGDERRAAALLDNLGIVAQHDQRWADAEANYEECLRIRQARGDRPGIGRARLNQTGTWIKRDQLDRARSTIEQLVIDFRVDGDTLREAVCEYKLAEITDLKGRPAQALTHVAQAFLLINRIDDARLAIKCASLAAFVLAKSKLFDASRSMLLAVDHWATRHAIRREKDELQHCQAALDAMAQPPNSAADPHSASLTYLEAGHIASHSAAQIFMIE